MDDPAHAVLRALQERFLAESPFEPSTAYRLVRLPGDVRIGPEEFAQCLDQLVTERHLTCTIAPDHEKRYAIRGSHTGRASAKSSLEDVFESIKKLSVKGPTTVKHIEAHSRASHQMVRTAIDILMATGVIKQTRRDQAIEIMWNPAQEMALLMCAANTQACVRMRAEIAEMDTAIADLRGILQRKAQRKS